MPMMASKGKRRRTIGGNGPRASYSRRTDLGYPEIAAVFRACSSASDAADALGLSVSGARSLRSRMRAVGWNVGEGKSGRPRMPRGDTAES